jgi:hypothetical protein
MDRSGSVSESARGSHSSVAGHPWESSVSAGEWRACVSLGVSWRSEVCCEGLASRFARMRGGARFGQLPGKTTMIMAKGRSQRDAWIGAGQ